MTIQLVETFVVDRSKWGPSALLRNGDDCMCCLGQHALACGVPAEKMRDMGMPESVLHTLSDVSEGYRDFALSVKDLEEIAAINDSLCYTPSQKEERLIEAFENLGIAVSFEGDLSNAMKDGSAE
jgi:hypothetical protein